MLLAILLSSYVSGGRNRREVLQMLHSEVAFWNKGDVGWRKTIRCWENYIG